MGYRERIQELNERTSNLEYIEDIVNSLSSLYSEEAGGTKKLPNDIAKYGSTIFVAHTQALLLLERLKENKVYEVVECREGEGSYSMGTFSSYEIAKEYKDKHYKDDDSFYIVSHIIDEKLSK